MWNLIFTKLIHFFHQLGSKFFKVYQNLVTTSPFSIFLPSLFLPCKETFMDDYDGI